MRTRSRRPLIVALLLVAVLALAATAAARPRSVPTITIGMINSATGSSAGTCLPEQSGAKLALAVAQKARWFPHVLVNLSVQDDSSTAAGGVAAFRSIVDSNDVAIAGVCNGVGATPIESLVDEAKIPEMISTAATPDLVTPAWAFRGGISQIYFDHLVVKALAEQGKKSVYVIHASDSPTLVWLSQKTFPKAFSVYGIKQVGDYTIDAQTVDFSPAIKQIQELKPDVVALLIIGSQTLPALTQMRNAGLSQPVIGQSSMGTNAWIAAASLTNGSMWATNYATSFTYPSSVAFTKAYRAAYGGTDPTNIAANGYDAMYRVLLAIKNIGASKLASMSTAAARNAIRLSLLGQRVLQGAQGPMTVTKLGDVTGPGGVVQLQHGQVVVLNLNKKKK